MPESLKMIMRKEIEEQSNQIKKTMSTLGATINKKVDLAQNLSKTIASLKRDLQKANRQGKKKLKETDDEVDKSKKAMTSTEKRELVDKLRKDLIKEWGDCLVNKPISINVDDRRYEQSEHRASSKKGSAHMHVFVHNNSSNKRINVGVVKKYFDQQTVVCDVDVQTIHHARKWVTSRKRSGDATDPGTIRNPGGMIQSRHKETEDIAQELST